MLPYMWTEPTAAEIRETADSAGNIQALLKGIVYNAMRRDIPPSDRLRTILEWAEAALLLEAEPIVISISGADYSAHSAHMASKPVIVIDYEGNESYDEDMIKRVPQEDGEMSRAIVYSLGVGKLDPVIAEFARAFNAGEDLKEEEPWQTTLSS